MGYTPIEKLVARRTAVAKIDMKIEALKLKRGEAVGAVNEIIEQMRADGTLESELKRMHRLFDSQKDMVQMLEQAHAGEVATE